MRGNNPLDFGDTAPARRRNRLPERGQETGLDIVVLVGLALATLVIPLVGIISGILDMGSKSEARRSQGFGLLCLGLVALVVYAVAFTLS